MPVSETVGTRSTPERALDVLRQAGNPFRNYFARNPDDEVCARYHVSDLFALERAQLVGVVDLYRSEPATHSEIIPILGNKGSGKTHLLHSIKHGEGPWQMLVTPGTYQKDAEFLEYLLFQIIDTLLGGGKQRGSRPLEFVGQELVRGLLTTALEHLSPEQRLDLFPPPGLGRWTRHFGLGTTQAQERTQWLVDTLLMENAAPRAAFIRQRLKEASLEPARACQLVCDRIEQTGSHGAAGLMRRHILQGFARAILLGDEGELANFLTFGFAELEFHVRPTRQDLVLALFKALMEVFRSLKIPVVVAFDQLEDLLLARRSDDGHRIAEAFFAGIVQVMHQVDGICFLIFAERGLWNRFVPSLDGYIQDRLNNPVHVPGHGTVKALRLEAPPPELVTRIVEARLRPALQELSEGELPSLFPFNSDQVLRIAKTEPTLRDMLQQFRHLFDHIVYGVESPETGVAPRTENLPVNRIEQRLPTEQPVIKSVIVVESTGNTVLPNMPGKTEAAPTAVAGAARTRATASQQASLKELWEQEVQKAKSQLEPEGSLTGATRELQAGLGEFLKVCHEHGVKVGPWRLQHVVGELAFGDHPTYGVVTIAHWVCKDGQPWKVGIGLFLGRGPGKPKDLEIKLAAMEVNPPVIDHLILLRPEDDLSLTGKSKTAWQDAERKGHHPRLEAVNVDGYALLYAFPRWLAAVTEALPDGQPLPNLAEFLQENCEKMLEQVCLPVQ